MANEADTFRVCVVPKLLTARWDNESHSIAEQRTFTDGRIVVGKVRPLMSSPPANFVSPFLKELETAKFGECRTRQLLLEARDKLPPN